MNMSRTRGLALALLPTAEPTPATVTGLTLSRAMEEAAK